MIEATAEQLWRRERKRFHANTSVRSLIARRHRRLEI